MPFDALEFTKELIAVPSVSADSSKAAEVARCAGIISERLNSLGFEAVVERTPLHPIVWAKRASKSGKANLRVLCYGHYDVQPVDPVEKWILPPFEPVVKNDRLYGRGSADNKGPFMCLFGGLMKFLEKNPGAPLDVAIMLEGEEEISSPSMAEFVSRHEAELKGYDAVLISDTSSPTEDQIVITTGLRGVLSFDVRLVGPNSDVHSGMFGGAVYNPIQAMSEICASLHSADGLVNVEGFYDGVIPAADWERRDIAKSPFGDEEIKKSLGLEYLYSQKGATPSEALRLLPTLEFTGIGGGYQGEGNKSVISSECFFKVSIRLVPNQNGERVYGLVRRAIESRCPKGVKVFVGEPDGIGDAYCVLPPDRDGAPNPYPEALAKIFRSIDSAIAKNFGNPPLYLREGGSIPLISMLKKRAGLDCVMTGLFTPADNLHAPNESFSLKTMRRAINAYCDMFESALK